MHDIGKNIVGVVLGCNNYEVIDLGVMVPGDTILDTAIEAGADAVGLSGLITPSLDEMVHVAKEMERRGLELPLLIGGATTSRQHTAVRIAPVYGRETVHVLDASRVVGVVSDLLDPVRRETLDADNREEQERLRVQHAEKERRPLLPLDAARANRQPLTYDELPVPSFTGTRSVAPSLEELRPFIDWQFFFHAWELKGKFPAILEQPAARELYDDAVAQLDEIVRDGLLRARGRLRLLARACRGRRHRARDRRALPDAAPAVGLGRLAPEPVAGRLRRARRTITSARSPSGSTAPTSWPPATRPSTTTTASIMVKALADRLAEAFAEWLHLQARREWYEPDAAPTSEELITESYRGIRPAFGYPACPDHSEKRRLFDLLDAGSAGIELTESFAMMPAAAVSGLYFGHPDSKYFAVGRLGRDQIEDYAARKGIDGRGGRALAAAEPRV